MEAMSEFDVIVVGSGNGGMTAAVCCHAMGIESVVVLEKGATYGGTSSVSGGGIWVPCSHYALEAGAKDSPAEARQYLEETIPAGLVDPHLLDTYVQQAPVMLRFLHDHTRVRYEVLAHYPDYFTYRAGGKEGYRSHEPSPIMMSELGREAKHLTPVHPMMRLFGNIAFTQVEAQILMSQAPGWTSLALRLLSQYLFDFPWRFRHSIGRRIACGSAGVARLRLSMIDRDIPLDLDTALVSLIAENGKVKGVVVRQGGELRTIKARKAVILAAGGFEKNQAMRETHLPKPTNADWSAGIETNTGDAIQAALRVGARFKAVAGAWWCTTLCVPGEKVPRLSIIEKSFPGACTVNRNGRRIANESQNYATYVQRAFEKHSDQDPCSPLYMIFDARFRRKFLVGPLLKTVFRPDFLLPRRYFTSGFLAKAQTIPELAKKIGVDSDGLTKTILSMNEFARTGKDTEFGRGDSAYDRYYADPRVKPNPCLAPISRAPFYAVRMELGDFGTHDGLETDEHARVLTESGSPIEGLYAIGNTAAAILPTYPGPGSTLGPAMTFGYLAAKHIARLN
jgi:3-oxosteroid 1-dehydrogenase